MNQSTRWIDNDESVIPEAQPSRRLSSLKFFMRYPIFLLMFGPPIFRSSAGIDATKGNVDIWAFIQVGWLSLFAIRAILRLVAARSIFLPKNIRSILRLAFILGLLYLASVAYSPSRFVSAAYCIFYFLAWICVAEFVVDAYRNPPNWIQCLFQLRLVALFLFFLVVLTLLINPGSVVGEAAGSLIRLGGGTVAPVSIICPIIAIISAYTYLNSLESKGRSVFFFLVGLAGTLSTYARGSELPLLLSLAILGFARARTGRRSAYLFISGYMASILLSVMLVGAIGGGRIWNYFNRGQSLQGIESASGRTEIWKFVVQYCMAHPQGMGYVAGFRMIFREYYSLGLQLDVHYIGTAHNSFFQVLADAGWLALAIYLIMMAKIIAVGWRFAKKPASVTLASDSAPRHAIGCALVLLIFCFANGMEAVDFVLPLRAAFYMQNLIIAIILGMSANMLAASRTSVFSRPSDISSKNGTVL